MKTPPQPELPAPTPRPTQKISMFQIYSQSTEAVSTVLSSLQLYNSQVIQLNEAVRLLQIENARLKKLVPHKLLPPKKIPPTKSN